MRGSTRSTRWSLDIMADFPCVLVCTWSPSGRMAATEFQAYLISCRYTPLRVHMGLRFINVSTVRRYLRYLPTYGYPGTSPRAYLANR